MADYVTAEEIAEARRVDLLTYLRNFEPDELVHIRGDNYCTRTHDSLKISHGKWFWFSQGIGGASALDYLVKVKGESFVGAVQNILGKGAVSALPPSPRERKESEKHLILPEREAGCSHVMRYLTGRGIDPDIVRYCIENKLLYESKGYHSCVFVGYDKAGAARYAMIRSTDGPYKGEATGSDKHYSFCISGAKECESVHLFEAAIDALSYATAKKLLRHSWRNEDLLSLAGVYAVKRQGVVPKALEQYLADHPQIRVIHLHLDRDEIGRAAAEGIIEGLKGKYTVLDEPPQRGKDVNEELQMWLKERKKKERCER